MHAFPAGMCARTENDKVVRVSPVRRFTAPETYEYQFAFPVREELPHEVRVLHIRHAETGSPPLPVAGGYLRRS